MIRHFWKNRPDTASFSIFSFFSHGKNSTNTINDKCLHDVLGTRTRGNRMVGIDESTELCRHPLNDTTLMNIFFVFSGKISSTSKRFWTIYKSYFCQHQFSTFSIMCVFHISSLSSTMIFEMNGSGNIYSLKCLFLWIYCEFMLAWMIFPLKWPKCISYGSTWIYIDPKV